MGWVLQQSLEIALKIRPLLGLENRMKTLAGSFWQLNRR